MRSVKSRGKQQKPLTTLSLESFRLAGIVNTKNILSLGAAALFVFPHAGQVQAQTASAPGSEEEIEEVIVTGSFIRNSQFTNASPVETITQVDLWNS